jgi:hypothetical protein
MTVGTTDIESPGAKVPQSRPVPRGMGENPPESENFEVRIIPPAFQALRPAGIEPATCGLGNHRSIQLSYERKYLFLLHILL